MKNGNILEVQVNNEAMVEASFHNIVEAIQEAEATLTSPERAELQQEPVCKPAGYADQGYRHG